MNLRNLSVIASIGAAALFLGAANADATVFQYLFDSGSFSYNSVSGFSGTETVTLANLNDSVMYGTGNLSLSGNVSNLTAALSDFTPSLPSYASGFTLNFLGGVYGPSHGRTISGNFTGGLYASGSSLPGFSNLTGDSGEFTMSSGNYSTHSSTSTGSFNGFISLSAPELGTSASMITMLMGAGFMNLRRRKKA